MQNRYLLAIGLTIIIFACVIIIYGVVLLLNGRIGPIYKDNDIENWVTLVVEIGVGVIIALIVFLITVYQQKEIRNILRRQDRKIRKREIQAIQATVINLKFIIRRLYDLQGLIDESREVFRLGQDAQIKTIRDQIRFYARNMQNIELDDIDWNELAKKIHSIPITLEIYVDQWDKRWDIIESKIIVEIEQLLNLIKEYLPSLENK